MDYLKFTFFRPVEHVATEVRDVWLAEHVRVEDFGFDWVEQGPGKRLANRWILGVSGVTLLDYRDMDCCGLELKGVACSLAGDEALRDLLSIVLRGTPRESRVVRVDYAWDGVPFTVADVCGAVDRWDVVTKCRRVARATFMQNDEGHTVYFPRRTNAERLVRVYDRRGPVRCELELSGPFAEAAGIALRANDTCDWSDYMIGQLRGLVDFVDAGSATRRERAALLPWWDQFVGSSVRAAKCTVRETRQADALRRLECAIERARAAYVAGLSCFEDNPDEFVKWWTERCKAGADFESAEHVEFARDLEKWRGDAGRGVTDWSRVPDVDVPF